MTKTIAIIPARGGSKRLPSKNVIQFNELPLIAHSINYAKAHEFIDAVYVSTDDALIKDIALNYGALVVDRPESLSGDQEPTITALKHVIETIDLKVDDVVLLQATNPLRPKDMLHDAYSYYTDNDLNSLFTVSKNKHKLGTIDADRFVPYNYELGQRSQDMEPLYFENGLLYITKSDLILNDTILSSSAYPLIMDHPYSSVDIDTEHDLDYANYILRKHPNE